MKWNVIKKVNISDTSSKKDFNYKTFDKIKQYNNNHNIFTLIYYFIASPEQIKNIMPHCSGMEWTTRETVCGVLLLLLLLVYEWNMPLISREERICSKNRMVVIYVFMREMWYSLKSRDQKYTLKYYFLIRIITVNPFFRAYVPSSTSDKCHMPCFTLVTATRDSHFVMNVSSRFSLTGLT